LDLFDLAFGRLLKSIQATKSNYAPEKNINLGCSERWTKQL
jgi:hypothetical protein